MAYTIYLSVWFALFICNKVYIIYLYFFFCIVYPIYLCGLHNLPVWFTLFTCNKVTKFTCNLYGLQAFTRAVIRALVWWKWTFSSISPCIIRILFSLSNKLNSVKVARPSHSSVLPVKQIKLC